MASMINILNASNLAIVGEVEVFDARVEQKINDKYTFSFSAYEQPDVNLLALEAFVAVDDDIFNIIEIKKYPAQHRYEVSCEHVSYILNTVEDLPPGAEEPEFTYTGQVFQIINEILDGTRFQWIPSDDTPGDFTFTTRTRGKRSQIIEFCIQNGFEVNWERFDVAIQTRRGADTFLPITLGINLRDLVVTEVFNPNNTITRYFDVDFVDLNKILDENGEPIVSVDFNMGDTVNLVFENENIRQRIVAISYDPFKKALPTIELENPIRDILEVIVGNEKTNTNSNNGTDIDKYFSEFRIGDASMLPIASDETNQVKRYILGEIEHLSASAVYETTEIVTGIFADLKSEYSNYNLTLLDTFTDIENLLVTYNDPWENIRTDSATLEIPFGDEETFVFVISDVPLADINNSNINDVFIKAFGVKVRLVDAPPPEMETIMYAAVGGSFDYIRDFYCVSLQFITNITNFRENFTDENFTFQVGEETNELYPVDLTITNSGIPLEEGALVQVVDGVISSVLSSNSQS